MWPIRRPLPSSLLFLLLSLALSLLLLLPSPAQSSWFSSMVCCDKGSFLNNGCLSCQLRKAALHGRGKRLAPANREAAEDLAGEEDSEIEEWR